MSELPTHIRRKLNARVEAALDPKSEMETLKSQIVDMVRDTQLELFQLYRRRTQRAATAATTMLHQAPAAVRQTLPSSSSPSGCNGSSMTTTEDDRLENSYSDNNKASISSSGGLDFAFPRYMYSDKSLLWQNGPDRTYESIYGSSDGGGGFASSVVELGNNFGGFGGFDGVLFDFTGVLGAGAPTTVPTAPDVSVWDS